MLNNRNILLIAVLMFGCLFAFSGYGANKGKKLWYQGGTLHSKTALDWQKATNKNKLATCMDFIAKMYKLKALKPSISKILSISITKKGRPYATQLVDFLDNAFKKDPNLKTNKKLFANQTVSGGAIMGMMMLGWLKK
jgi:hypothetical protein